MRTVETARNRIDRALTSASGAGRLREGLVVVIAGRPNVGKSTLMNVLAGRDVAITSPFAGTTRDSIEAFLDLDGYPVVVVDTAGVRETDDPIEREGVERAKRRSKSADLVLWLQDEDVATGRPTIDGPMFVVRTKVDRQSVDNRRIRNGAIFDISAKTGEGIPALLSAIGRFAEELMSSSESSVLTLERHRRAFREALSALTSTLTCSNSELELVAENLRRAASCLDRVIGRIGVEDVLGEIFGRLCIGK